MKSLRVRVLDLDGKPAAGRAVHLYGLERSDLRPMEPAPDWDFQTDANGCCTAHFAPSKDYELPMPRWGVFIFRVDSGAMDAGAFSRYIVFQETPEGEKRSLNDWRDSEWGTPILLASIKKELTLRVKAGIAIRGRVLEYPAGVHPLAGIRVTVSNDVHSDTHTGMAGIIEVARTETGADGSYVLKRVYPATCYLAISKGGEDSVLWLKTRRGSEWKFDAEDKIEPRGVRAVKCDIMAGNEGQFHYSGRVVDSDGMPVTQALVCACISYHRHMRTYKDEHSFENAITDDNGHYDLHCPTPWVNSIGVIAPGFPYSGRNDGRVDKFFAPGAYNFELPQLDD